MAANKLSKKLRCGFVMPGMRFRMRETKVKADSFLLWFSHFQLNGVGLFCQISVRTIEAISPILIDISGNGFNLTGTNNPVSFDFFGKGIPISISWTKADSDDAFLVLDRNGNGTIDNGAELFGNITSQPPSPQKNGFLALAEYDKPSKGGNNDGKIKQNDAIFSSLRLWQDINHNGVSETSELHTLNSLAVKVIDLEYYPSTRQDNHGNWFKYKAKVRDEPGASVGRWAYDVFFVKQ